MNANNELSFAINNRIKDAQLSSALVPLALLGEFQKDVKNFLAVGGEGADPTQVEISIEESLLFRAIGLVAATTLWADLDTLK